MILLTTQLRSALRVNAVYSAAAEQAAADREEASSGKTEGEAVAFDPAPLVKFFNPAGAATWLATELYEDEDTLFGLADLGFGCPELGCFSLSEITSIRLPFGLRIERDLDFSSPHPLSVWADAARRQGSIIGAQSWLAGRPHPANDTAPPERSAPPDPDTRPDPELPKV